jgi:hypothetical protein
MDTRDSIQIRAASREFERGHSSKAIANSRDAAIHKRMCPQSVQTGRRSPAQFSGVVAKFHDAGHHALTVTRNAIAIHVTGKRNVTQLRESGRLPSRMLVETSSAMNHQDAGRFPGSPGIGDKHSRKINIAVTVFDRFSIHSQPSFFEVIRLRSVLPALQVERPHTGGNPDQTSSSIIPHCDPNSKGAAPNEQA